MAGIGPQLPPHLLAKSVEKQEADKTHKYGPSLPPRFVATAGPALPPGFITSRNREHSIGPSLQGSVLINDDDDSSDEDEIVGPCLPNQDNKQSADRIREEFEARADAMKNKLTGEDNADAKLERETWMLELPPSFTKDFGLGPRTFRTKATDLGDRSVWTDTPSEKEKRKQERRKEAESDIKKRKSEVKPPTAEELEMQARVEEYNKQTRPQSLLEMHQEKRKKTEADQPSGRRPFDRDRDLTLSRSDPKENAKFIQNAKKLNSKFSKGTFESKFL